MPFFGTVPNTCIEQILRITDFDSWGQVYVGCSGTLKIEEAIRSRHPDVPIHANDVSLFSCPLGWYYTDDPQPINFHSRLEWVNEFTDGKPYEYTVAAVLICNELARYSRDNPYCKSHFRHIKNNFLEMLVKGVDKLQEKKQKLQLTSYYAGDWRDHMEHAIEANAGIASFPSFFAGDYESQFKFISSNIAWNEPSYRPYSSENFRDCLERVIESGINYCLLTNLKLDDHKPTLEFVQGRKVPHYCYTRTKKSSVRHLFAKPEPFLYTQPDPRAFKRDAEIKVIKAEDKHLNFIKDVYLAKGIIHSTGLVNYMVYIDNQLAGGIIYALQKYGVNAQDGTTYEMSNCLYLLSDVTLSNDCKLSKLLALMATSKTLTEPISNRLLSKITYITTTARSLNPVSMKYRGIYELNSRRPSDDPIDNGKLILQYGAKVQDATPTDLYKRWFDQYSGLAPKTSNHRQRRRAKATQTSH